jgi:hypothetical protein
MHLSLETRTDSSKCRYHPLFRLKVKDLSRQYFQEYSNFRNNAWTSLLIHLDDVQLSPGPDRFRWNLYVNGNFSVDSFYKAILQSDIPVDNNKKIWKIKISLKNKKIGWYLRRGVILTKDNFVKRNWHESTRCVFCHQDETIKHLFFQCRFARSIWSVIQVASSLYPPTSVANVFENWLHSIDLRFRMLIRIGALAVIWALWLCRNDKIFNNKNCSLLQVIYRYSPFVVTSSANGESHPIYGDLYTIEGYGEGYFFSIWVTA